MKPKVDQEKCINCGLCFGLVPEVFELDIKTGKATVKENVNYDDYKEPIKEAVLSCPTDAISCDE